MKMQFINMLSVVGHFISREIMQKALARFVIGDNVSDGVRMSEISNIPQE